MDYGTYTPPTAENKSPRSPRSPRAPRSPRSGRKLPDPPPKSPSLSARTSSRSSAEERYQPLISSDGTHVQESGCRNCGAFNNRVGAKYCSECGLSLVQIEGLKAGVYGGGGGWSCSPGRYALFGWLETVVKCFALVGGLAGFSALGPLRPEFGIRIIMGVVTGLIIFAYCFVSYCRWHYREFTGLVLNVLCAITGIPIMVILFRNNGRPGTFIVVWHFCLMLSELIKIFYVTCFRPPMFDPCEQPILDTKVKILGVAIGIAFLSMLGFALEIFVLTSTFIEN